MREKFRRFMTGRYGVDDLGRFTLYFSLGLLILSFFIRYRILYILAVALLAICYLRMFSRNISRRYEGKSEVSGLENKSDGPFFYCQETPCG